MSVEITMFGIYFLYILFIIGIVYIKENRLLTGKINNFNFEKFLPSDEIRNLKQIFLLAMSGLLLFSICSMFLIYDDYIDISILCVILTTIAIAYISSKDYKHILLSLALIPAPIVLWLLNPMTVAMFYPLFVIQWVGTLICVIYFIHQFFKFTKKNNLGFTVIIFILILIGSCFITSYYEQTNLIDSIVMISNAFTSNGYTILGTSKAGKINSIILVWGGYLLSGVGTATLTAAIVGGYLKSKIESQEEKIDTLTREIKEMKELMKK